jgi:hypothetical protein
MTDAVPTKKPIVPLTKIRIQVPKGVKIEEIVSNLQLSFEEVAQTGAEINKDYCCVDVSVVGPFSTVSHH